VRKTQTKNIENIQEVEAIAIIVIINIKRRKLVGGKSSHRKDKDQNERPKKNDGKVEEFSVEYWNRIRAELGMKALPEK